MDFILNNWSLILGAAIIVAGAVVAIIKFVRSNRESQIKNIKEWLLYATALAEKELGSGTGKLKLRCVYDMFVVKFPWLARVISFETFSSMVDEALGGMNNLLESNNAVRTYVKGTDNEEEV